MGCDTSKESVQPGEDDVKEDVKNGEIPKATEATISKKELQKSPSESRKEGEEGEAEARQGAAADLIEKQKEVAAATAIQAVFRGYNVRKKSMKDTEAQTNGKENGARMAKARVKSADNIPDTTSIEADSVHDAKNELDDIDLADEKLNTAAATIQVGFRRHMKRKEETGGKYLPVNNGNSK